MLNIIILFAFCACVTGQDICGKYDANPESILNDPDIEPPVGYDVESAKDVLDNDDMALLYQDVNDTMFLDSFDGKGFTLIPPLRRRCRVYEWAAGYTYAGWCHEDHLKDFVIWLHCPHTKKMFHRHTLKLQQGCRCRPYECHFFTNTTKSTTPSTTQSTKSSTAPSMTSTQKTTTGLRSILSSFQSSKTPTSASITSTTRKTTAIIPNPSTMSSISSPEPSMTSTHQSTQQKTTGLRSIISSLSSSKTPTSASSTSTSRENKSI